MHFILKHASEFDSKNAIRLLWKCWYPFIILRFCSGFPLYQCKSMFWTGSFPFAALCVCMLIFIVRFHLCISMHWTMYEMCFLWRVRYAQQLLSLNAVCVYMSTSRPLPISVTTGSSHLFCIQHLYFTLWKRHIDVCNVTCTLNYIDFSTFVLFSLSV